MSDDCEGQGIIGHVWFWNQFFVIRALWTGALSYWKWKKSSEKRWLIFPSVIASFTMSIYLAALITPSHWMRGPTHCAHIEPLNMMADQPFIIVGATHYMRYFSFGRRQTMMCCFVLNSSKLLSSVNSTLLQLSMLHVLNILHHFKRAWTFFTQQRFFSSYATTIAII